MIIYLFFFFLRQKLVERECESALQHLRGQIVDISQEAFEIRVTFELQMSMRK